MATEIGNVVEFYPTTQYPEFRSDGVGATTPLPAIVTGVLDVASTHINLFVIGDAAVGDRRWIRQVPHIDIATADQAYWNYVPRKAYTFSDNASSVAAHNGAIVSIEKASAVTYTLGASDTAFPIGTEVTVIQAGGGEVEFVAGVNANVVVPVDMTAFSRAQFAVVKAIKFEEGGWILSGDLDPV